MINNNKSKKEDVRALLTDLNRLGEHMAIRSQVEDEISRRYHEAVKDFDVDELESLIGSVTNEVRLSPVVYKTSSLTAQQILFNPKSPRWWADKAVDVATTAIGASVVIWGAKKLGAFEKRQATNLEVESVAASTNPFSDSTPCSGHSRVGQSRPPTRLFDVSVS